MHHYLTLINMLHVSGTSIPSRDCVGVLRLGELVERTHLSRGSSNLIRPYLQGSKILAISWIRSSVLCDKISASTCYMLYLEASVAFEVHIVETA